MGVVKAPVYNPFVGSLCRKTHQNRFFRQNQIEKNGYFSIQKLASITASATFGLSTELGNVTY